MTITQVKFPGPRPLTEHDVLVGRDEQIQEIIAACGSRDVITITAWSGVGKTSFVQAGLIPRLEAKRYYRVLPRPLTGGDEASSGAIEPRIGWAQILNELKDDLRHDTELSLTAEKVYRLLVGLPTTSDNTLVEDLELLLAGQRAVVILDQFEELLRSYGALGDELLKLVTRVAPKVGAHIIIARSEYRDRLRPVEDALSISVRALTLNEIDAAFLPDIFKAPFGYVVEGDDDEDYDDYDDDEGADLDDDASADLVVVDAAVTDRLRDWWLEARQRSGAARLRQVGSEGLADVGLLQFQAASRAFVEWVQASWGTDLLPADADELHLTLDMLTAYVHSRAAERRRRATPSEPTPDQSAALDSAYDRDAAGGGWLFQDALTTYVSDQMGLLSEQELSRPEGTSDDASSELLWWRQGPSLMAARVAPAFTVAGFKQPQALYSLLAHALDEELSTGRATQLGEAIQAAPDDIELLLKDAADSIEPAGAAKATDKTGDNVLAEMIDALHAALLWLCRPDVNIFRRLDRDGEPVFELVHDGMGEAFKAWAVGYAATPLATFAVIGAQTSSFVFQRRLGPDMIATSGVDAEYWGNASFEPDESVEGGERLVLTGLSFPSAAFVDCSFTNVTLRDCVFRGSSFVRCQFENVVFEDCDLRALLFLGRDPEGGEQAQTGPGESTLHDVTFRSTKKEQGRGELDLLTIKWPKIADGIVFRGVYLATGVFLQGLPAGGWRLENSVIYHLVIEVLDEDDLPRFDFNRKSEARAVSARGDEVWGDVEASRLGLADLGLDPR
ncbi:MAG: pentapeptide repeat-containing protein [Solirubrobacteraceae bacterium]|nr:pentapeptide repeat-containing protein [Patulibacter sp.]